MHRNYRSDLWILIRRPHVLEWLQSLLAHIRPHSADHRRAVRVSHSFLRLFFFLLFMFLRLTRGGAASCVGMVTGLAFFYILLFAVASAASRLCICSEVPGIVRMFNSCRGFMYKPDLSLSGPPLPLPPAAWSWSRKCDRAGWVLIRDPPTNKQACEGSKRGLPVNQSSCHVSFWRRSRLLMMQFFLRVAPTNKLCTFVASSGAERELFEVWGEDERWVRVF